MVAICPQILTSATCNDLSCAFNHNVTTCEPCRKVFDSALVYRQHLSTTEHGAAVRIGSSTGWLYCSLCNAHPCGVGSWNAHIRSNRHTRKAKAKGISPAIDPESVDEVPNHKFCATCNRQIPNGAWERHVVNEKHLAKESYASFTAVLEEAEADRHGVAVTGEFDFGVVEVAEASVGVTKRNRIAATVTSSNVRLVEARLSSSKGRNSTPTPFTISTSSARVSMRIPIALNITAKQAYAGREEDRLELVFEDTQLQAQFIIVKTLRLIVGNKAQYEALQPSLPYAPKRRSKRHPEKEVEPGVKAPSLGVVPYVVTLPKADIPETLKLRLQTGNVKEITAKLKDLFLPKQFNEETYSKHFRNLLWVEEFRMSADLEHYDVSDAVLTKHNQFYYVNVPGLAEKRPSVLVGDSILVRRATAAEGHWFEGIVHVVRKEEVGLRFGGRFHTPPSVSAERFTMRFKLNRYPLRRQHQALTTAFAPKRLLFPVQVPEATPNGPRHAAFNTLIDQNQRQRLAVDSIVRLPGGSAPFVVFGPPGTGKTVTVVEAIRQLLVQNPKARILACAPSNSAADLIALRLLPLGQRNLFRFYAPSRPKNAVPDDLEAFTYKSQDHFSCPPPSQVAQYKVCISTCVSASVFFGVGVPRGHFTHIFIDEAGQATEPEAMIAIKTMADNKTNVVLSGDPKQLGPIIRSAIARDLGLEISYIERLMRMGAYHPVGGHGKCVVKLTQNFRSHPAILKFPNEKFYNNDLVACGRSEDINAFVNSAILPPKGKKFPILFVGMSGKDDREASSPSFFNIQEALMVKEKVQQLRGDRKLRLSDADIGIITPYHAQVQKIRKVLLNYADEIKVGSVEEFQGQERKVIIISTVRSSREYVEYDLRHTLGFVASPRRFNVAVTRAKALLIVIGDPLVLSLDPLWRQFLNYIHKNGGWTGKGISWDPNAPVDEAGGYDRAIREAAEQDMNDFTRQMESMTLDGLVDDSDYVDVNIDRPWNRDAE